MISLLKRIDLYHSVFLSLCLQIKHPDRSLNSRVVLQSARSVSSFSIGNSSRWTLLSGLEYLLSCWENCRVPNGITMPNDFLSHSYLSNGSVTDAPMLSKYSKSECTKSLQIVQQQPTRTFWSIQQVACFEFVVVRSNPFKEGSSDSAQLWPLLYETH